MREMLLEALQRTADVDEPEATAAPLPVAASKAPQQGREDGARDMDILTMSEDELLRAMQESVPRSGDDSGRRQLTHEL
jgi:hypothetical protein